MSDQKICPTCGTEYPLSERFCPRDGTALRSGNAQADLLGSVVADRYHILKKLGEGGMGTVYLAEHVKMGRKSALKVMNPGMNTDADAIARFNREASNASRLSHPNICGIYDFGETPDGLIYLAMEYIEGSSLSGLIEKTGSMPPARSGSIIHQTADALQVAHDAGIVHRDLKPDNIMVARNRDGTDLVKVVDFGIAKASSSDAQKVTKTGLVVGTPEYMSPEQLAGDTLDGRSDIYSLGLVAFNCLTGKLPFPAENATEAMIMRLTDRPRTLAEMRPDISWTDELQRTMNKVLERDATNRYQSASQFGREFAAAISAMPSTQAVEAGTLVMGAANVAAARDLPKTNVDRPSAGVTVPIGAVAVAPKSRMPMIAGGGGLVAVAAVAAFLWLKTPGNTPLEAGATTVDSSSVGGASTSDDTTRQVAQVPPAGVTQGTGTVTDPATKPEQRITKLSNPTTAAPPPVTAPTTTANDPADNTDSDENPNAAGSRLDKLIAVLERGEASIGQLQEAAARARAMRSNPPMRLRPLVLGNAWYVEMMAEASLLSDHDQTSRKPAACAAAREVAARHPDATRKSDGANTLRILECR